MSLPPLLITYYNNIPSDATNYFTILDGNIIISNNDMMNSSCSSFMTNTNNNLIYIFNGPNMGYFSLNNLVSSDQNSITYSINLNSIPLNLTDNILCVLSLTVTTDSKKFTINIKSVSKINTYSPSSTYMQSSNITPDVKFDDTLFLYIIATNKSFNIIVSPSNIYTISNVTILPESNSNSIIFSGTSNSTLNFADNTKYVIYISTENASTVSNVIFNNTQINPLNYSDINLTSDTISGTSADMSKTDPNTLEITPLILNQKLTSNKTSLNSTKSKTDFSNQCVKYYKSTIS
jgi:hypothetical protein